MWLKRYASGADVGDPKKVQEQVCRVLVDRGLRKDKTKACSVAREYGIDSENTLLRLELYKPKIRTGANAMVKLRTGTFKYGYILARQGKLPQRYLNSCLVCKQPGRETLSHILLECNGVREARVELDKFIITELGLGIRTDVEAQKKLINILLGGVKQLTDAVRIKVGTAVASYLTSFVKFRAMEISRL